MRHRGYNVCQVCGEAYDCGERHECPGSVQEPPRPQRVDKHLEACRRAGQYRQPGCKLSYKR